MGDWTFFSNHGHVLVCLASDDNARLRDVAIEVGITERAVQKIVKDLQTEGYIEITKQGRCNRYRINRRKGLRHDLQSHCTVGKLLQLIIDPGSRPSRRPAARPDPKPTQAPQRKAPQPKASQPVEKTAKAEEKKPPADTRQQRRLF